MITINPQRKTKARAAANERAAVLLQDLPYKARRRLAGLRDELDNVSRYIVAVHDQATCKEIGDALGVSKEIARKWLTHLVACGVVSHEDRVAAWPSEAEIAALTDLVQRGYGRYEIAQMRGCDPERVRRILDARGVYVPWTTATYTLIELSAYFDTTPDMITLWVRRGWFGTVPRSSKGKRACYRVSRAHLEAFAHNRESWVAWGPAQITDPALRRVAEEARAAAGGRWYASEEVAARLGVHIDSLKHWRRRGFVPVPTQTYSRAMFYWLTDAQAAVLPQIAALHPRRKAAALTEALR